MDPLSAPASDGSFLTPSDSVNIAPAARSLYVGGAGNVVVQMTSGTTLTFYDVPAGSVLPVRARRVGASTSATSIIALF